MVLGYWQRRGGTEPGICEPRVRHAVEGVYDFQYDGHGNWPFNTAYAAVMSSHEAYVMRLRGFDEAEEWLAQGVPLIISYGWAEGELDGAPLPSSAGHLAVLSGFDGMGNPIVHDPAALTNESVPRTYQREQLERLWLRHSGGTVYVIAPRMHFDTHHLHLPLVLG
jgi:hypothetical protein